MVKSLAATIFILLLSGCSTSYLDRSQMHIINSLFYPDGEWPNEQLIAKAIEMKYEGKSLKELNKFVVSLYGNCAQNSGLASELCQFELQCVGNYSLTGNVKSGMVTGLNVTFSGIVCD